MYDLIEDLTEEPSFLKPSRLAVALGVFDGVHRGHQALLAEVRRLTSADPSMTSAVLTFDPPPAAVFSPHGVPPLLGTLAERAALLHAQGMERVIVARFDASFATRTPQDFVDTILRTRLNAGAVVVGEDFRFGRDRRGNALALSEAGAAQGFAVRVIPPLLMEGVPVRSTIIRQYIASGRVEEAALLLDRPYRLWGEVVHGRKLGRTLGYPTANLGWSPSVLAPGAGVYAGRVSIGDESFRAAISVGDNPTVSSTEGERARTVEAFLLDGFRRDIYGARIGIDFVAYLRGMEKFDDLPSLQAQMARDVEAAKARLR